MSLKVAKEEVGRVNDNDRAIKLRALSDRAVYSMVETKELDLEVNPNEVRDIADYARFCNSLTNYADYSGCREVINFTDKAGEVVKGVVDLVVVKDKTLILVANNMGRKVTKKAGISQLLLFVTHSHENIYKGYDINNVDLHLFKDGGKIVTKMLSVKELNK